LSTILTGKQRIIDSAITIFNSKGFDGTSIREIAQKANVNVSNISYYFKGKTGLLEFLIQTFFDGYLSMMEDICKDVEISAKNCLLEYVSQTLHHHAENHQLSRFVYREMTKDTTLIREVMSTYLAKEKFYFKKMIDKGISQRQFEKVSVSLIIIQLKSLLSMPFLQTQYISEVLHIIPTENYFVEQYIDQMNKWVQKTICLNEEELKCVYISPTIALSI
jgi:AcrR family transcriptional regulator